MGVCSLLWKFYVDKKILIFFPLLCGYFYFFWIIPARHVLLRGLEQVGCLIRCSLLNFSFQLRASGFFCWILTAILHFIVFWALTWSNVVRWCKELQNVIFTRSKTFKLNFSCPQKAQFPDFRGKIIRFSEKFQILEKKFRFSKNNQIFGKISDFWKKFRAILETCDQRLDTCDTDYISDN